MAEVSFSGSAVAGLRNTGSDTLFHREIDLDITFSGETDNGLTFGASLDLDENSYDEASIGAADPEIFISGAFGTLTLGRLDPMIDAIGIADVGFDGIGVDNDLEDLRTDNGANTANLTYVYEGAGFTFGLSYSIEGDDDQGDEGDYGILLGYEVDGFSAEIAYGYNESADESAWGIELGYSTDMYGVKAVYIEGNGDTGFGLEGTYTIDALTITAVYSSCCSDADFGIGAEYDFGGGLSLAGGIGEVNQDTVWDLGLKMSF